MEKQGWYRSATTGRGVPTVPVAGRFAMAFLTGLLVGFIGWIANSATGYFPNAPAAYYFVWVIVVTGFAFVIYMLPVPAIVEATVLAFVVSAVVTTIYALVPQYFGMSTAPLAILEAFWVRLVVIFIAAMIAHPLKGALAK